MAVGLPPEKAGEGRGAAGCRRLHEILESCSRLYTMPKGGRSAYPVWPDLPPGPGGRPKLPRPIKIKQLSNQTANARRRDQTCGVRRR
jgi:hypothetical protein